MSNNRVQKLAELLKEEISEILLREVKDPRIGFVSLTKVDVSEDLRHAKVYVSVYGSDKEKEETMAGLEDATNFVRKLVGDRITTYHTPEIIFRYDDSIEHGVYMSKLINEVREEDKKRQKRRKKRNNNDEENNQN